MLDFTNYPIQPALQPYMQMLTAMSLHDETDLTTNFSATTNSGLVFFFGSQASAVQYEFMTTKNKHYTFDNRQAWIGGMHNEAIHSKFMTPQTKLVCAVFRPLGIYHLLRDDSSCLMNDGISFENAGLMKKFDGLIDKLYDIEDNTVALKLVESYLFNYFSRLEKPFSVKDMSPVINFIVRQKGMIRVQDLEEKFRISRRWLEKQFADQVGFSPKEFARITRFKSLLGSIQTTPSVYWSSLVEDFGYYDQSHLNKDFRQFTGQSPTAYFKTEMLPIDSLFN